MNLTIELTDHQKPVPIAKAREQGVSAEQYARQVLQHDLEAPTPAKQEQSLSEIEKPLQTAADIILSSMRGVPPEIMATMPKDGASQHDHYIYGWPKRDA